MATIQKVPRGGFNPAVHRQDGITEISLTGGKIGLIDTRDWDAIKWNRWSASTNQHGNWYIETSIIKPGTKTGRSTIRLHKFLSGDYRDHKNGNGLDNRRENLRPATKSQNSFNCKSRRDHPWPHGVSYKKELGKWMAQITVNHKHIYLGVFLSPEAARSARIEAEKQFHPTFERLAS